MNLGDVLHELGDTPLKGHTWCDSIVSNLNAILPNSGALTPDSTGRQTLATLIMLPEIEKNHLLASEVDLVKGTLTLTQGPEVPAAEETKSQAFHQLIIKDLLENPKGTLALVFGVMTTIAILVLVVIMTVNYAKTGKSPDTSLFTTLIKAMIDIFSSFSGNSGP